MQQWFALVVTPRHEKVVAQMLDAKGYETFVPLYTKRHQYGKRSRQFELPLFPGYLFCRFNAFTRFPILTTPGVVHVIGAGHTPIPVDEKEMASLQTASRVRLAMVPWPFCQQGQKVHITEGPLSGIEGIVVTVKQQTRLVLSVTLLQRSVLLEVDADRVSLH